LKSLTSILKTLLFLVIGGGLLWHTFKNQDLSLIFTRIKNADLSWVVLSIIISVAALISRSMRWKQLIEPLGYKPRLSSAFNAVMFGYAANMAIPRLGEVSRCGALSKSDDIPFEKLIGTVIIERTCDVIMLVVCILLSALFEFDLIGGFLSKHILNPIISAVGNSYLLGLLFVVFIIAFIIGYRFVLKHYHQHPIIVKLKTFLKGLADGLVAVTRLENKWLFLFHTLFIWVMYFLMTYVCFFALPETSGLSPMAGLFIMVIGAIGMTAPVQGGIGVYHLLVSEGIVLFGLTPDDGITFATLVHSGQTLLLVLLGGISMIYLFFFTKPISSKKV
jgi:uncharacterized protein (TIRG00374 family)